MGRLKAGWVTLMLVGVFCALANRDIIARDGVAVGLLTALLYLNLVRKDTPDDRAP